MHAETVQALMAGASMQYGFLGALIGGAISLVGGLSARSKAKKDAARIEEASKIPMVTDTEHAIDLDAMNASAIKAGYNPMTLLMAGGLSAFTKTTNTTTGHNAMAGAQAQAAVPSAGSVIAGALAPVGEAIGNAAFRNMSPLASGTGSGTDYFPAAPRRLTSLGAVLGASPGYGTSKGATSSFMARPTMSTSQQAAGLGQSDPSSWTAGDVEVTAPSYWLDEDPSLANADLWESRDGDDEITAMINSVSMKWNRLWYNTGFGTHAERREKYGKPILNTVKKAGALSTNAFDAVKKFAAPEGGNAVGGWVKVTPLKK